jgi:hypothetical protein
MGSNVAIFYERRITYKVQCSLHIEGARGTLKREAPSPNIQERVKNISPTAKWQG